MAKRRHSAQRRTMDTVESVGVVLHVDDDADARDAMSALLNCAGFEAHGAATADAALSVATALNDSLDVLIVDYHLGTSMTGTDVAESITRHLRRSLPTVILTGDPANAQIPLIPHAPVWLIRKPAYSELLVSTLPSLVDLSRAVKSFEGARAMPPRL
jgi:CheY-like chemotaxis protein